jgi:hypothetical protein
MKQHRESHHGGRVKHPEIHFGGPRGRIGRQEDLGGAEEIADQDPGGGDADGDGSDFDPLPLTLLEDAFRGAPAMEDGNDGDEGDVEEELHDQTGLEEGEARSDGAVGGVRAKEGGGTLSGEGDDSAGQPGAGPREIRGVEGNMRGMGG